MKKAIKILRTSITPQRKLQQSVPKADDVMSVTPVARAVVLQNPDIEGSHPVIDSTSIEHTSTKVHRTPVAPIHASDSNDLSPAGLVENEQRLGEKLRHSSPEGCPQTCPLIPFRRETIYG
jgi:hypothetical protein